MKLSEDNTVRLKLAAALVAFAAGAVAVLVVVLLAHSTPSAGSTSSGPQAASAPSLPPAASSSFPAPPADAVVLAKEDRDLAVGLAVSKDGSLQASVIGQEGPASGLTVALNSVRASACGAGCYRAHVSAGKRVSVAIRGPNRPPTTVSFSLPASAPAATAIVRRAERAWLDLRTLVVHDHLSSGPGTGIDTVWQFKAPHEMTYRIRNGPAAVAIGPKRWDKLPGRRWQASDQDPITEPVPLWKSVANAHLLSSGRGVWQVSFFDQQLPAWFTIWVDKASGRTLKLSMTAQAHFMHQAYGPFDRPLRIVPPV